MGAACTPAGGRIQREKECAINGEKFKEEIECKDEMVILDVTRTLLLDMQKTNIMALTLPQSTKKKKKWVPKNKYQEKVKTIYVRNEYEQKTRMYQAKLSTPHTKTKKKGGGIATRARSH